MADMEARVVALDRIQTEVLEEMANSLGRIGRKLEELITKLRQIEEKPSVPIEEYSAIRKEARLYYWYLIVQRESIGLRNHNDVTMQYRIPPSILQS